MRKFVVAMTMVLVASCGGGGSGGDGQSEPPIDPPNNEPSVTPISGGAPDSPVELSLASEHLISSNSFYNYFRYTGVKGEKLVIHAQLNIPLSDTEKSRCSEDPGRGNRPSSYDRQIHIYNSALVRVDGICGEDLIFTIPEDGDYIFQPEYPSSGGGIFYVASVVGNSAVVSPSGVLGQPGAPASISFDSWNKTSENTFYNYYATFANEGDKIVINTALNTPLSVKQKRMCAWSPGTGTSPSSYDTQIHVYDSYLNRVGGVCGEDFVFIVPVTGWYIFHFSFAQQSAGYFNAAIINQ